MNAGKLSFQKFRSLSVVQFRTDEINSFEYISLADALKNKFAEVTEVSESGDVNSLRLVNYSSHFIFMSDGDVLSGAKQNRVLNTSVLVSPKSNVIIPVSCVEQGRWRYSKKEFSESDYTAPADLRSGKAQEVKLSLKNLNFHKVSQSAVWDKVSGYETLFNLKSSTSNLSDIYEDKKIDIEEFIKSFKTDEGTNGLAIFVYNRLLNLEIFNRSEIYNEYFTKLLKSAAFDTLNLEKKENTLSEAEAFYKTTEFLDNLPNMKLEIHNGVGAGIEKRFESKEITGFELEYENKMIHYVVLSLKKDK